MAILCLQADFIIVFQPFDFVSLINKKFDQM